MNQAGGGLPPFERAGISPLRLLHSAERFPGSPTMKIPADHFFLDPEGTIPDNIDDDQSLIIETHQGPSGNFRLLSCRDYQHIDVYF